MKVREYTPSDFDNVVACLEALQDYLVPLDPLKRVHHPANYGVEYTKLFLKKINTYQGKIFIAEENEKIAGVIGGIVKNAEGEDLLDSKPARVGRTLELFVYPEYRSHKVGWALMRGLEEYFKKEECDIVRVEVFKENHLAHDFYKQLGYEDRMIDMAKVIS